MNKIISNGEIQYVYSILLRSVARKLSEIGISQWLDMRQIVTDLNENHHPEQREETTKCNTHKRSENIRLQNCKWTIMRNYSTVSWSWSKSWIHNTQLCPQSVWNVAVRPRSYWQIQFSLSLSVCVCCVLLLCIGRFSYRKALRLKITHAHTSSSTYRTMAHQSNTCNSSTIELWALAIHTHVPKCHVRPSFIQTCVRYLCCQPLCLTMFSEFKVSFGQLMCMNIHRSFLFTSMLLSI